MYEELLENIAQKNGLREVNTYLKLVTGLGGIILCLVATSYIAPLFIAIILTSAIILLARIDWRTYGELFIVPFSFAGMSIAVIILVTGGNDVIWQWNPLPLLSLSITKESINEGVFVFCRVVGGMAALIFISLTTPMTDLFIAMRQCRIPSAVLDLTMILYRSIFIIMDHLVQTYHAQLMRLGYTSFSESIRSFATLSGSTFIASWEAGEDLIQAMNARCYTGKFAILGEPHPIQLFALLAVLSFLGVSSIIVVLTQNIALI